MPPSLVLLDPPHSSAPPQLIRPTQYAGTAEPDPSFASVIDTYFRQPKSQEGRLLFLTPNIYSKSEEIAPEERNRIHGFEAQRVLAASFQAGFERVVLDEVERFLPEAMARAVQDGKSLDGVVLTGGCALNVPANFKVAHMLANRGGGADGAPPLQLYVPPAPNDAGLAVGALWSVAPPHDSPVDTIHYTGPGVWDPEQLPSALASREAHRATVVELATRLLSGEIIGVVRGRAEFGPRALGHRSLLAAATDRRMLDRLNRLKHRQWYR